MTPLYIALDFRDGKQMKTFLDTNHLRGVPVKVGMELFYREGPAIVEKLKENNHPIFLDLKLHDIPTTVQSAMRNIAALEVDVVNVHALGGREMIHAAKEGILQGSRSPQRISLVAVTVLTSLTDAVLENELSIQGGIAENAQRLARMSFESGADGVVCSAHESVGIKEACNDTFLTVIPGIRLHSDAVHDQKRVATPAFARENKADMVVMGRSITESPTPLFSYKEAKKEWEHAAP